MTILDMTLEMTPEQEAECYYHALKMNINIEGVSNYFCEVKGPLREALLAVVQNDFPVVRVEELVRKTIEHLTDLNLSPLQKGVTPVEVAKAVLSATVDLLGKT